MNETQRFPSRFPLRIVRPFIPAVGVITVLGAIVLIGNILRQQLRQEPKWNAAFGETLIQPAPPLSRELFLAEVQYLAELPDYLYLLDATMTRRLAEGFALHPWVAKVERVVVTQERTVSVSLKYRKPVLAVEFGSQRLAVDASGVLLPSSASTEGLPVFDKPCSPPRGPSGTPWGDVRVESAAREAHRRQSGAKARQE